MERSETPICEPWLESHIESTVALCRELSWPSYLEPGVALAAFSAPGAITWVARRGDDVVGLVHLLTDGHVQAHLSLVGVSPSVRRQGIARALIQHAFRAGGSKWLDLVSEPGSEAFYRSFVNQQRSGFRIYPNGPVA